MNLVAARIFQHLTFSGKSHQKSRNPFEISRDFRNPRNLVRYFVFYRWMDLLPCKILPAQKITITTRQPFSQFLLAETGN